MTSGSLRRSLLVVALAWLMLAGCSGRVPAMEMKAVDAGGGFTLSIPNDYAVGPLGDRVRVYLPARENSRSPVNIVVSTVEKRPDWKDAKTRQFGERAVLYVIREEDGGSGGTALRLRAWTEVKRGRLFLESVVQPDVGGDAGFHAEWAILAALQ